jgi:hypothetical protein
LDQLPTGTQASLTTDPGQKQQVKQEVNGFEVKTYIVPSH